MVLLLDAVVPVLQESEALLVCSIVDKHDLVGLAKQVQSDVLEDVLSSDVDHVELDVGVAAPLNRHLLERVFAALSHHVIMVEVALAVLVDDLGLADAVFAGDDHARSKD